MSDGAHGGITPERALGTILGGKPAPTSDEGMSVQEMRAWIEAAPDKPQGYDGACRLIAKWLLQHYTAHPEDGTLPADSHYEWPNGHEQPAVITRIGLYDSMKEKSPTIYAAIDDMGITGFMWGWAVNAARRCFELPPVSNPAILTIGGDA